MNTEKLSPFEGLRLVANAAKGYIAQQIAEIAGTLEGIVTDLNTSITNLEQELPNKLNKVEQNKTAEIITAQADGTISPCGKKVGGATLSATPNQNTVATEQAVKSYVDTNSGVHDMFSKIFRIDEWIEQIDGTYTISFTHPSITEFSKLDISCDTETFEQLLNDGVSFLRVDNDGGTATVVCAGAQPTADITTQITIVKVKRQ